MPREDELLLDRSFPFDLHVARIVENEHDGAAIAGASRVGGVVVDGPRFAVAFGDQLGCGNSRKGDGGVGGRV